MSWKIEFLGIYSRKNGALRKLKRFKSGLNIVSGKSSKGKSSLLDIVDYVTLSKHCQIAKGVIRDKVSHVGAVLVDGTDRLVIVRSLPASGKLTSGEVFLERGQDADLPSTAPRGRWNLDSAKDELSEFTGIDSPPVLTNDSDPEPDKKPPANIRHCVPYLLQPQDVIASRSVAFPGIDDVFVRRHVIDALAYFLGILSADRLRLRLELRRLLQESSLLERQASERQRQKARGLEHGLELLRDATAQGLAPQGEPPASVQALLRALEAATNYRSDGIEKVVAALNLTEVQDRESRKRAELNQAQQALRELRRVQASLSTGEGVAAEQVARLRLRDLMPGLKAASCPLCENTIVNADEIEQDISAAISSLEATGKPPKRLRARLERQIGSLSTEVEDLQREVSELQMQLRVVFEQIGKNATLINEALSRERLTGRIREYLTAMADADAAPNPAESATALRIQQLESQVGDGALRKLREKTSAEISSRFTALISELDVEFPNNSARLNLGDLAYEIRFDEQWVRLSELGSGANWLGYHVAGSLALHDFFITHKAPVPRLLMLDQPSQVWFPAEVARITGNKLPAKDAELASVRRVYSLLHNFAERSGLQIVVADHALLDSAEFKAGLLEDWHDDEGLVPSNW